MTIRQLIEDLECLQARYGPDAQVGATAYFADLNGMVRAKIRVDVEGNSPPRDGEVTICEGQP